MSQPRIKKRGGGSGTKYAMYTTTQDIDDVISKFANALSESRPGVMNMINEIHGLCVSSHNVREMLAMEKTSIATDMDHFVSHLILGMNLCMKKLTRIDASGQVQGSNQIQ